MITAEMIARINELAKKQREAALTDEERTEQALLRRQYIDHIKGQVKAQLDASLPSKEGQHHEHQHDHHCGCGCHGKH